MENNENNTQVQNTIEPNVISQQPAINDNILVGDTPAESIQTTTEEIPTTSNIPQPIELENVDIPQPLEIGEIQENIMTAEEVSLPNDIQSETVSSTPTQTIIDTEQKSTSNTLIFVFIGILLFAVLFMDKITEFFEKDIPEITQTKEENKNNLVDGFILIGEKNNQITVDNIRFYYFTKGASPTLTFNYLSEKKHTKVKEKEIYIEVYNKNKEILYKELFNVDNIEKGSVRSYKMVLTTNVYEDAYYVLVKTYTKEEKEKIVTLECTFEDELYSYKNTYTFKNNLLNKYEILKEKKEKTDIEDTLLKQEFDSLGIYAFNQTLMDNKLYYSVEVNNKPENYTLKYDNTLTPSVIKSKETIKKWICK